MYSGIHRLTIPSPPVIPLINPIGLCISKVVFISMNNCTIDCIEVIGNFSQEATCHFVQ